MLPMHEASPTSVATAEISPLSILRGERNLGPLEHAFREYSLKADVNQIVGMGWILIVGTIVYAIFDNPPQTIGAHFFVTLFMRAGLVSFSLLSIWTLKRTMSYGFADWWIFIW